VVGGFAAGGRSVGPCPVLVPTDPACFSSDGDVIVDVSFFGVPPERVIVGGIFLPFVSAFLIQQRKVITLVFSLH